MHLLAINFRDPGHPEAGGAELHLEHVLLDAVRRGWRVTWLAGGFPLSAVVQTMRKTQQTSLYLESLGPFFVGRVVWQSE